MDLIGGFKGVKGFNWKVRWIRLAGLGGLKARFGALKAKFLRLGGFNAGLDWRIR